MSNKTLKRSDLWTPNIWAYITRVATLLCLFSIAMPAYAQTFSTTSSGQTIGPDATCNTALELDLPITVSGVGTITDVDLGVQLTSTYRGDIRLRLTSPAGTTTELVTQNGSAFQDNYNIVLNDSATDVINTGGHTTNDGTTAPPYENDVSTNNAGAGGMGSFTGQNANGVWTLNICDAFNVDAGVFGIASLIFSSATDADLNLSVGIDNNLPQYTDTVTLTYDLVNGGPSSASAVTVNAPLPSGLSFVSASTGAYNSASGLWTLPGTLAASSTSTLTITATVLPSGSSSVTAEVQTSSQSDPDSTPGNGITSEDDYASLTFFPQPPLTPPSLSCAVSEQFTHSWTAPGGSSGWAAGEVTNSYTVGSTTLNFVRSGNIANLGQIGGTDTPVTQNTYTGGISPAEYSLGLAADHDYTSEEIVITADIGTAGIGIEALQFSVFDIDLGGWVDRLTITGEINNTTVLPTTLTPSGNNFISGNSAIGRNGNAGTTASSGNVTVTFNTPIDKVIIAYGNDPSAGPDPAFQIMAIHEFTMCPRLLADITAVKSVEVYDPLSEGLYMTPGNEVLYKITVTNSTAAEADANDIDITDTLPDNVRFVSATTTGFTAGAFGSPALPAANTDCVGGACVIRYSGGSLPIDTTGEIIMRVLIK